MWYGGIIDLSVFHFIAIVADSKSRHRLFFYPTRKWWKEKERPLRYFLEVGGLVMKREDVSTLFIHSYLWALSCLLDHFWNCFVWNVFVVGFESIFEKRLRLGKLCNDSRLYKNVYKVLVLKIVQRDVCFWKDVLKVWVLKWF